MRVVVRKPFGWVELIDRVTARFAIEQLRDCAVFDGANRRVARREDVDRLMRMAAVAGPPLGEGALEFFNSAPSIGTRRRWR